MGKEELEEFRRVLFRSKTLLGVLDPDDPALSRLDPVVGPVDAGHSHRWLHEIGIPPRAWTPLADLHLLALLHKALSLHLKPFLPHGCLPLAFIFDPRLPPDAAFQYSTFLCTEL